MKPFSFRDLKKSRHEKAQPEDCTVEGETLKNPQIYTGNLLIEVHFKAAPEHTGGVLIEKLQGAGYSLALSSAGRIRFSVQGPGASAAVESRASVTDEKWHHVIAELDRAIPQLTIYLDGRKDASARGIAASVSLANDGDLYVAGSPTGRWFERHARFSSARPGHPRRRANHDRRVICLGIRRSFPARLRRG